MKNNKTKIMKKLLRMMAIAALAIVTATSLQSCNNDDDDAFKRNPLESIVTLKTTPSTGQFYMQANDSVTLIPTNLTASPFGNKEVRARVLYELDNNNSTGHYSYAVHVDHIDTILTKTMSPMVENIEKTYGLDPLEIFDDGITGCDDGYLTVHFSAYFGGGKHVLRLVKINDSTVQLCHDNGGDIGGGIGDDIVAFRLTDMPDTEGQYKSVTVKWKSFSGDKSAVFKYKSRE